MGVGASEVPPLPEGCAIVAVALPLGARLKEYARSGDAITQCCQEGWRRVFEAERGGASAQGAGFPLSI